jgi:recombinational DNA repair protein (RecF pathway)
MMVKAGLTPLVSYPGSDKGWLCRCNKCNREVTPAYGSIKVGQGGCKWCKDKTPWVDPVDAFNLMLKNQIQPLKPFKNSHTKWESRCLRCEKTVFPSYHQIAQGKGGCRYCAPNFVDEKRIYSVMKKAGLTPLTKYVNSKEPWKVKHEKCGRTFFVEYANIRGGSSCRYCAGLAVVPKEAVALLKQRGLTPLTPYPGGNKPWKCRCNVCQKVVSPRYTTVARRNSGCIYCAGRKVDPKDAVSFMKKNNLSPLVKYPGASKPWKCRCENCKRVIAPMYTSVRGRQGGCRFCADWGIDYRAEGFFYLMTHPKYRAHKVGIGNSKRSRGRNRIAQHQKHGWKLFKKIDFAVTDDAFSLEQKVLDWLRLKKKLDVYLSEFEMPQGGYTETVDASEIDLPTIWAKVEQLSRVKK